VSKAARLARLQKKLADLDHVLVVHILGRPTLYIGSSEAVSKEQMRRQRARTGHQSVPHVERASPRVRGRRARRRARPGKRVDAP
jgi:hypothetical protein